MNTFRIVAFLAVNWFFWAFSSASAQVIDDFSDGDFTQNPTWSGDTERWQVNAALKLQSNGRPQNDTIYLSTPLSVGVEAEWRFDADFAFAPSGSNLMRFYLFFSQPNLKGPGFGYFIQAGENGNLDSYDLFRQDGATITRLIDGEDGLCANRIDATLRVTRSAAGVWEVWADSGRTGIFRLQGQATDTAYVGTGVLGVWVRHTSTRANAFFFDDIYGGPPFIDSLPPAPTAVRVIGPDSLEISFNEPLDPVSAAQVANYRALPVDFAPARAGLIPGSAITVGLYFSPPLPLGPLQLQVAGVADLAGNLSPPVFLPFTLANTGPLPYRTVRISEVMADPNPPVNLPDAEYFELVNTSSEPVSLTGWTFDNGTTRTTLPELILPPGGYAAFCRTVDLPLFEGIAPMTGLSPWPVLVNNGDELGLRSATGQLMDTLEYRLSWYKDPAKVNGGYSLELADLSPNECPDISLWAASNAEEGGTPGRANSLTVPPDTTGPRLVSFRLVAPDRLRMCFDRSLSPTLPAAAQFSVDFGRISVKAVEFETPERACLSLDLSEGIAPGDFVAATIPPLADCRGGIFEPGWTLSLVLGKSPEPFDLIISEIYPDPTPSPGLPEREFVEIYNRSGQVIDLDGVTLADPSRTGRLSPGLLLPGAYVAIVPNADTALWSPFGPVAGISSLPTLNNNSDSLFLRNSAGALIDFLYYEGGWADPDKRDGGWTLEKRNLDLLDCNLRANWGSSLSAIGGTPGAPNTLEGSFSDDEAPAVVSYFLDGPNSLRIRFSEPLSAASLEETENFEISPGLGAPVISMATNLFRDEIRLEWAAEFDSNQVYTLDFSRLSDCSGNLASGSLLIGFPRMPQPGEVLIHEILFNPYVGGVDFVEIYHNGPWPLDLKDLRIGAGVAGSSEATNLRVLQTTSSLLLPGDILCLTTNPDLQRETYLPPANARFLRVPSLPAYPDSRGAPVLLTASGVVLDRFDYESSFHYPALDRVEGVSLERISVKAPTQDRSNWQSAAEAVRFATPGYPNSQTLRPDTTEGFFRLVNRIFSPDGDGQEDVLAIACNFPFPAANLRITVFDLQGRKIRLLQQNTLLGAGEDALFFWNGLDERQRRADVGLYVIVGEVLRMDTNEKLAFRRVAVLAERL